MTVTLSACVALKHESAKLTALQVIFCCENKILRLLSSQNRIYKISWMRYFQWVCSFVKLFEMNYACCNKFVIGLVL